ncbi:MAG: SUMF1/EgtB/PvdO family nonheme iron enzyme [Planctomycetaceae bacterium]
MELTQRFQEMWKAPGTPPDVFAFLRLFRDSSPDEILAVLLEDQRRRWRAGNPFSAEDYLAYADLPEGLEWQLELVVGEFQARHETNQPVRLEELTCRYPEIAETLRDRVLSLTDEGAWQTSGTDSNLDATCLDIEVPAKPASVGVATSITFVSQSDVGARLGGRYRLDRVLGEGAFGRVYLGFDTDLQRQVAIKVANTTRFRKSEDAETYLAEARTVASLDHPHIVSVYDMGHNPDGSIFVVTKFIDGYTLEERIKSNRPTEREAVQLAATVARALAHAHARRLIHRDIKPANILIEEKTGAAYVADFGLAVREEDSLKENAIAGTPSYMSPEQARGEGHRLDGRSDIFSLGAVLYELLTHKKPFRGNSILETLNQVISLEPKSLRERRNTIPAELERICLKALSKRASDRYATAVEFAEDLEEWLKPAHVTDSKAVVQVVPKGLRSFDADDADYFLDLLPGARNREGLPESIAFWKSRIEQTDSEQTFSVGLIYGPSGCGKSSLVKAGLLPHISAAVTVIYVEATPQDTETRILRSLRKRIPELADNPSESLAETLAELRRSKGQKVVVIVDQFEQWLHAHRSDAEADLVKAMRQCDGGRLQTIVMVRDDFAMAAARFMNLLEVPIVQGVNFATFDLFDIDHATKVLTKFGQAFGRLPVNTGNLSPDERQFVRDVVHGLAQDGKVVSVRLSLFAEMVKGKSWTPSTLKQVGGTDGVGVNFLEETFSSPQTNPHYRLHATAARAVLRALLPELSTDIKGHMRSNTELLEVSGYQNRPAEFMDVLRILDGELRLITPTDPEGHQSQSQDDSAAQFYQLTHDYLVPSLREWLTRKQIESRTGRAELKLAERSVMWNLKPENRHLPSLSEWLRIRSLVNARDWTLPQRTMMHRAGWFHGMRALTAIVLLGAVLGVGLRIQRQAEERRIQAEATRLVEGLLTAETEHVKGTIENLKDFKRWADPLLNDALQFSGEASNARLHACLALIADQQECDPRMLEFLHERILTISLEQMPPVLELLQPHKAELSRVCLTTATDEQQSAQRRLHAACALARFAPGHEIWKDMTFTKFLTRELVTSNPVFVARYQELLRGVGSHLIDPLTELFKSRAYGELSRTLATSLLADYAANAPDRLADLIVAADTVSDRTLFPVLRQHQQAVVKKLEFILDRQVVPDWQDPVPDPSWKVVPPAVQAKIEMAHGAINDHFAFCLDMPLPQFLDTAEALRLSGYRPTRVRPCWSVSGSDEAGHDDSTSPNNRVAAVWTRDGKAWEIEAQVKSVDLPPRDMPVIRNNLTLIDIAPLYPSGASGDQKFIAVWSEPASLDDQRRVVIDATEEDLSQTHVQMIERGFGSQCTVSVRTNNEGQRLYSGIWSGRGAASKAWLAYPGFEMIHQPLWDIAVAAAESSTHAQVFSAVWHADLNFESRLLQAVAIDSAVTQLQPHFDEGFRPVAIAVDSARCSVILHRPLVPDSAKEELALQQAAAATALLRLDAPARVWPLFRHGPDPRLSSLLPHRMGTTGVDPGVLLARLEIESDPGCRRGLILAIGECAREKSLPADQQTAALKDLKRLYNDDSDPGIHGAAEWALKQLKAEAEIAAIKEAYATGLIVRDRQWYLTKTGQQTMIVIQPAEEFLMGSPITEEQRFEGPAGTYEFLHRRRINHNFAIGAEEITVARFLAFRRDHPIDRSRSREEDAPANTLTWYDAAAYCNWLSEQEGIPREEWCYDPQQPIAEGMRLPPNYLQRTGYRLPTEAEWEYACRAGSATARFFGETETLLSEYAWYIANSGEKWMLPVGTLKPNPLGLFDIHGNALEWCQDPAFPYDDAGHPWIGDREFAGQLSEAQIRILRGGSFLSNASYLRSAYRYMLNPGNRSLISGCRVARTMP